MLCARRDILRHLSNQSEHLGNEGIVRVHVEYQASLPTRRGWNYSTSTGTWFPWWKLFLQCIICSCSCTILNDSSTGVSSLFGAILKLWIVAFLIVLITVFLIFKSICMHEASAKWMHASVKVWCDVLTCISHLLMLRINPGVFLMKKQAFYLTLFELKGLFVQVKTLPHNARITHGNTT